MRRRVFVLPAAAAIIAAMVWYKLSQEHPNGTVPSAAPVPVAPAPDFEALDSDNSITRLKTWLGRHQLFVVFFSRDTGAAEDAVLQHLKEHSEALARADFRVLAISSALPQENRSAEFPSSFSVLTDPEPACTIHRQWGCFDEEASRPTPGLFHIDRAGNVATVNGVPVPLERPNEQIDRLLGVSHQ